MLIHSSRKKVDGNMELFIDGLPIEQVRVMKFLGVLLNDTLTWGDHIAHISTKVSRSLNLLRRLSWFLPKSLLLLYFKSYVIPTFDYCDVAWSNCTTSEAKQYSFQLWLSSCSSQASPLLCLICQTGASIYNLKQQKIICCQKQNGGSQLC